MNAARAYAKTQTETASKERLMALLFERALLLMRTGAAELEAGRVHEGKVAMTKAGDIVAELSATLDVTKAPELGQVLKDVYLFVCGRLVKAATTGQAEAAREAERVFAPVAEAFTSAVAQLGSSQQVTP